MDSMRLYNAEIGAWKLLWCKFLLICAIGYFSYAVYDIFIQGFSDGKILNAILALCVLLLLAGVVAFTMHHDKVSSYSDESDIAESFIPGYLECEQTERLTEETIRQSLFERQKLKSEEK